MMKSSIKILLIYILINANLFAKNNEYYYMDGEECSIAIPIEYHILNGFTKNRIAFFQKKDSNISNIVIIKENQRKYIDLLKDIEKNEHNILIEEKKIGHLLYQKFKVPIAKNMFEYRYNIFGNNFFWGSTNVKQRDVNYMIKHCIETYNGGKR